METIHRRNVIFKPSLKNVNCQLRQESLAPIISSTLSLEPFRRRCRYSMSRVYLKVTIVISSSLCLTHSLSLSRSLALSLTRSLALSLSRSLALSLSLSLWRQDEDGDNGCGGVNDTLAQTLFEFGAKIFLGKLQVYRNDGWSEHWLNSHFRIGEIKRPSNTKLDNLAPAEDHH